MPDAWTSSPDGGRSFLSVADDGIGITREELPLAMERHATSKLLNDNLETIATLGFRGKPYHLLPR